MGRCIRLYVEVFQISLKEISRFSYALNRDECVLFGRTWAIGSANDFVSQKSDTAKVFVDVVDFQMFLADDLPPLQKANLFLGIVRTLNTTRFIMWIAPSSLRLFWYNFLKQKRLFGLDWSDVGAVNPIITDYCSIEGNENRVTTSLQLAKKGFGSDCSLNDLPTVNIEHNKSTTLWITSHMCSATKHICQSGYTELLLCYSIKVMLTVIKIEASKENTISIIA